MENIDMEALRQTVHISKSLLHLVLPKSFDDCDVEVIVLAEKTAQSDSFDPSKFMGLINMPTEKIDAELISLRRDWERDLQCI